MSTFSLDDLRRVLTAVAGEDEEMDLSGDIGGVAFEDLGYDSLALMEMAARISQEYGIHIRDDEATELKTPRDVLATVDHALRGTGTLAS
jgi:act minimal PKS acyl carrier protein